MFSHFSASNMFLLYRSGYVPLSLAPVLCSTHHHLPPSHTLHTLPILPPQSAQQPPSLRRQFVTRTPSVRGTGGDRRGEGKAGSKKGSNGNACPQCGETFKSIGAILSKLWMCFLNTI